MRFAVEGQVFERLPDLVFGGVVAYGIDNHYVPALLEGRLEAAEERCRQEIAPDQLKTHPAVLPYRTAFQNLGINPNRFPSSIEAMLKRVLKGSRLPTINPVVDLGNSLSLKYLLPMGAHDLDQLTGEVAVRFSRDTDRFVPLGEDAEEVLQAGELIYADACRVRTRRWIWRQSQIGCVTPESRTIFFPIDGFSTCNRQAVENAAAELETLLREGWNCRTHRFTVDAKHPCAELGV